MATPTGTRAARIEHVRADDLNRLREELRDPSGVWRGFSPYPETLDQLRGLAAPKPPPAPSAAADDGVLTSAEIRLLNVFKGFNARPGQCIVANMVWAAWCMFGGEAELRRATASLKRKHLLVTSEGRGGLALTEAGWEALPGL